MAVRVFGVLLHPQQRSDKQWAQVWVGSGEEVETCLRLKATFAERGMWVRVIVLFFPRSQYLLPVPCHYRPTPLRPLNPAGSLPTQPLRSPTNLLFLAIRHCQAIPPSPSRHLHQVLPPAVSARTPRLLTFGTLTRKDRFRGTCTYLDYLLI